MKKDIRPIPRGYYCYTRDKNNKRIVCPYWSIKDAMPEQDNGYCSYLKKGDWEFEDLGLLWDMCKECNIKIYSKAEDCLLLFDIPLTYKTIKILKNIIRYKLCKLVDLLEDLFIEITETFKDIFRKKE